MIKIIKKFEEWELHHKVVAFNLLLTATILIVRVAAYLYDPNIVIMNFEIHHFDYGLILLFITTLLLLFHKRNSPLYLIMAAIAFGLIIDELWFVRGSLNDILETKSYYDSTLLSSIVLAKIMTVATILVYFFRKKKTPATTPATTPITKPRPQKQRPNQAKRTTRPGKPTNN